MRVRPNIVLVMTDQQRWDTIAALGHEHAITPNLDRMVVEGTSFDKMFVTAPSCAPSRASLFSGLYPHTTGVFRNEEVWQHSWVERLAGAGYRCVNVGKMHTYPYEASVGFHERHVVENKDRAGGWVPFFLDTWDKALWTRGEIKPDRRTLRDLPDYRERLGAFTWDLPEDLHVDNFVGDLACHWLDSYPISDDEPFFLQIGFPGPHPPYDAVPKWLNAYADRDIPMPVRSEADLESQPAPIKELREMMYGRDMDAVVHLRNPTPEQMRRQRQHYLANVSMIDAQIGALFTALERRGVLDDTVVIFTSDHGDELNDHGCSQKWTMYESSVHVPALVWAPGLAPAGKRIDALVSLFDLGPTVLELAGVEVPDWMEARSLVPALAEPDWQGRDYVFAEHASDKVLRGTALMTMVRDRRHKLVEFIDSEEGQLFDLRHDQDELHNLWDSPEYADTRRHLQRTIAQWRAAGSLRTGEWLAGHR